LPLQVRHFAQQRLHLAEQIDDMDRELIVWRAGMITGSGFRATGHLWTVWTGCVARCKHSHPNQNIRVMDFVNLLIESDSRQAASRGKMQRT
jgi:hypothetical protein